MSKSATPSAGSRFLSNWREISEICRFQTFASLRRFLIEWKSGGGTIWRMNRLLYHAHRCGLPGTHKAIRYIGVGDAEIGSCKIHRQVRTIGSMKQLVYHAHKCDPSRTYKASRYIGVGDAEMGSCKIHRKVCTIGSMNRLVFHAHGCDPSRTYKAIRYIGVGDAEMGSCKIY